MAVHMRIAGRSGFRLATGRRRLAAVFLAAGAIAFTVGAAILVTQLAPMFGAGWETATVAQPAKVLSVGDSTDGLGAARGINDGLNSIAGPSIVDRPVNGVAFQIRVPPLKYSAKVFEGIDTKTLDRGPGHYPTTAWPGRDGTVGIAAHNVYWLSFNRLRVGDHIELQTTHGLYLYAITGSKITVAGDVGVLKATAEHRLVLTTCYPLWAGAFATKRLVFFAREIAGVT